MVDTEERSLEELKDAALEMVWKELELINTIVERVNESKSNSLKYFGHH